MFEPAWLRLDLHVMAGAAVILVLGWVIAPGHDGAVLTKEVGRDGVHLRVPATWLVEPSAGGPLVVRGEDAVTRLEIRREETGELVGPEASLDLARVRRYGDLYQKAGTDTVTLGGVTWQRTSFAYAFKPTPTHTPRVAAAVEYASPVQGGAVTVVTLHAPEERLPELERSILAGIGKDSR